MVAYTRPRIVWIQRQAEIVALTGKLLARTHVSSIETTTKVKEGKHHAPSRASGKTSISGEQ